MWVSSSMRRSTMAASRNAIIDSVVTARTSTSKVRARGLAMMAMGALAQMRFVVSAHLR